MNKIKLCNLLLVCVVLFLGSCTSYYPKMTKSELVDGSMGYIYGVLLFKARGMKAEKLELVLTITNVNTNKKINLVFDTDYRLSLAAVSPGNYRISAAIGLQKGNEKLDELSINGKVFTVRSGEAVYIGDIIARGKRSFERYPRMVNINSYWWVYPAIDEYSASTDRLEKEYPNSVRLLKVNQSKNIFTL